MLDDFFKGRVLETNKKEKGYILFKNVGESDSL